MGRSVSIFSTDAIARTVVYLHGEMGEPGGCGLVPDFRAYDLRVCAELCSESIANL